MLDLIGAIATSATGSGLVEFLRHVRIKDLVSITLLAPKKRSQSEDPLEKLETALCDAQRHLIQNDYKVAANGNVAERRLALALRLAADLIDSKMSETNVEVKNAS